MSLQFNDVKLSLHVMTHYLITYTNPEAIPIKSVTTKTTTRIKLTPALVPSDGSPTNRDVEQGCHTLATSLKRRVGTTVENLMNNLPSIPFGNIYPLKSINSPITTSIKCSKCNSSHSPILPTRNIHALPVIRKENWGKVQTSWGGEKKSKTVTTSSAIHTQKFAS